MRFVIVEDDLLDRVSLNALTAKYPFLVEVGVYDNPNDGLAAIRASKPDLVFLDIEMPGMSGVDMLRYVRQQVPVAVFITSHPEFALEGFELAVFDYLLKPATEKRFAALVGRLQAYWKMKRHAQAYEALVENEHIVIKAGYKQIKLPMHEIVYLEAMQDYTRIVTEKKCYLTLTTLSALLEKLATTKFRRVHRSYAVALAKIDSLANDRIVCGSADIPIGKTYRAAIAQLKL